MSFFSENRITTKGLALLAHGQIGESIIYTRIVLGDGYISEVENDITDVINPRHEINITKFVVEDGKAVIGGPLILDEVEEGFYYRELGVYAKGLNEEEILYSYGNAGDLAEWIDQGEGGITERFIELVSVIDNAPNVSAMIDSSMFVTFENLDNYYNKSEVNSLIGDINTVRLERVDELPSVAPEENVIYLVPASQSSEESIYDKYIWVNAAWEKIGSTDIDLSEYYTKSEVDSLGTVLFKEQSLTPTEQNQARLNINAASPEDIMAAIGLVLGGNS